MEKEGAERGPEGGAGTREGGRGGVKEGGGTRGEQQGARSEAAERGVVPRHRMDATPLQWPATRGR